MRHVKKPFIDPKDLPALEAVTLRRILAQLAPHRWRAAGVVVCACGFVSDHLEVLYDLDIEAAARAARAGLEFDRTACVNDDAAVMTALADRVIAADRAS